MDQTARLHAGARDDKERFVMKINLIINRFNFGEVSPLLAGRVDFPKYQAGCQRLENFIPLVQGPVRRRGGTRFVAKANNGNNPVALLRFEFSESTAYIIEVGNGYLRFYNSGVPLMNKGAVYQISSPWQQKHLFKNGVCLLKSVQSGDVVYIVCPGVPPKKLMRYGHTDWRIADLGGWPPKSTKTITETVTVEVKISNDKAQQLYMDATRNDGGSGVFGGFEYDAELGIKIKSGFFIHEHPALVGVLIWKPNDGYYKKETKEVTKEVDSGKVFPNPSAICIFRERLCLGAEQTLYMSASGAFEDFALTVEKKDDKGVVTTSVLPDDPIEIKIYGDTVNEIEWLCPSGSLLVGTSGGEFIVAEATTADPLGPGNIKIAPQTSYGSAPLAALRVGSCVLFVQRSGRKLREFVYDYTGDSYSAQDLAIAAEHITLSGIKAMAWQSEPEEILWLSKGNGELLGFTYNREQEMTAWHRHSLAGAVESLAVIPAPLDGRDELWLSVRRKIGGQIVRHLEVMTRGLDDEAKAEDAFFVDSGITYNGAPTTVISGLNHLEGCTVNVLADGGVQPPEKVSGGKIEIQFAAKKIQAGLPFRSLIETLPMEIQLPDGTAQGRIKRIVGVSLRVHESMGGWAGPDETNLQELEYRRGNDLMDEALPLANGDIPFKWPGGYETKGSLTVVQTAPLPFTLCAIIPEMILGG